MVRAIVGTMVDIGLGKLKLEEFEEIIIARDLCKAGKSAPAKGLFLVDIAPGIENLRASGNFRLQARAKTGIARINYQPGIIHG